MSTACSSIQGETEEPPRKRVRKGTKSCWECKRRKIRCSLSTDNNVAVCSGCMARGTTCLSQEYPEEHDPPGAIQVGERLGRVEMMLEKLVATITKYEAEEEEAAKIATPESMGGNDVLSPFSTNNTNDNAPIFSLFDNEVIGRRNNASQSQINTPSTQSGGITPSGKASKCTRPSKLDRLRQVLLDLLPCQRDVDIICTESSCYLLLYALALNHGDIWDGRTSITVMSSTYNLAEVSKLHPTVIAKSLLYLAVCSQQLPGGFDTSKLQLGPSLDQRIEKYMSTVQSLITSDDEVVSTIEGLECLLLQGIYHINCGNLRRAWLTFRRALNVGQLMGIHRGNDNMHGAKNMWYQILQGDRYLALLLGLPAGSSEPGFGPEETFQNPKIDKDILFSRYLCDISSRIIERNQAESTHTYATTQEIDERLENLAKEMPSAWWVTPTYFGGSITDMAVQFDRLMVQIWYYQLEALLHLPFMLRAAKERRYDYSKFSCLKASREMIHRYLALRLSGQKTFCCKVVDFGALTATVTLFLGQLLDPATPNESRETQRQRQSDRALVQTVLDSMEALSIEGRDVVATQSANVIRTLLEHDSSSGHGGNLRLTIPYFGTISIARAPSNVNQGNLPQVQQQHIFTGQLPNSQTWEGLPFPSQDLSNAPLVKFTSSQFPPLVPDQLMPGQDWQISEADTLFFDSLLNSDIEGNWIF